MLKSRIVITIAVAIFAACLVYLLREFQWQSALQIVASANIGLFLAGSVVSIVTYWFFRTCRWAVLLNLLGHRDFSFRFLYMTIAYSLGLSMVMPLQSGEILKVEMLKNKFDVPRRDGYFALAFERILDIIVVILITIICLSMSSFSGERVISALVIMLLLLVVGIFCYLLLHFFADQFAIMREIKARTSTLAKNPSIVAKSILLTVLAWMCVVFGWWVTLRSIGVVTSTVDVTALTTGMTLVNVVSFIPGSIGVSEVGISVWLNYLGVEISLANAGALMLRAYGLMLLVVGVLHWGVFKCFLRRSPE